MAQRVLDRGTLVISRAGVVIGSEDFVIRTGRTSGDRGLTVASRASYPPSRPQVVLVPVLELTADSQPAALQIDVQDGMARRVVAELAPRRISIRTVHDSRESVRQYPAPERVLFLDDSAFALHAIPPTGPGGPVLLLWVRSGVREDGAWSDRGVEPTDFNGQTVSLRHVTLSGPFPRDLWYDDRGHLAKVEVPSLELRAARSPLP
ncbi:MAG: hypothetical protein HY700_14655 [Gemmatimonadetes bacterium]|nr:hypothetical protein [Gemmatimonadota bacterium]